MIARNPSRYKEAIAFLQEGERNNPESIEIEATLGGLYTSKLKDYEPGVPYLVRAIALGQARDLKSMTDDELEAYEAAYRWYVLNRRDAGDQATAHRIAVEGQKVFPLDVVCRDYLREYH